MILKVLRINLICAVTKKNDQSGSTAKLRCDENQVIVRILKLLRILKTPNESNY